MDIKYPHGQQPFAPPAIGKVVDSAGTELGNPGTTSDTALTLSGTATASAVVIILDDGRVIDSASVRPDSTWTIPLTAALGAHTYVARVTGDGDSSPWVITVQAATEKPFITQVQDAQGVPVPHGSNTFSTSVTVSGTAEPGSVVEIDDGGASWGTAPAPGGNWTKALNGLTPKGYRVTAKALDSNEVSAPWEFTVELATVPSINYVRDSKGEILNEGSTFDTRVTLIGTAHANEYVEVFDGLTSQGKVLTNASRYWTHELTGLNLGLHVITVRGDYGSKPESGERRFSVKEEIPPLTIDTSPLYLTGVIMNDPISELTGQYPSATFAIREARGGVPPYTYSASTKAVDIPDPSAGLVRSQRNGDAIITVTDQSNQSASYPAFVSNVYRLFYSEAQFTHPQAVAYAQQYSFSPMTETIFSAITVMFQQPFTHILPTSRWNCSAGTCGANGHLYLAAERRLICEYADRPNSLWGVRPSNLSADVSVEQAVDSDFPPPQVLSLIDKG